MLRGSTAVCMYVRCDLHSHCLGGHESISARITYEIEFLMINLAVLIRLKFLTCAVPIRAYICRTYVGYMYVGRYGYSSTNPR